MDLGILFLGVLAQIIGAFIAKDKMMYAGSLWLGVLLALAATYHMYRSLDRALDQPEKTAQKMIFRGYILRYVILIFILLVLMKTEVMNPLIFFFSYVICMKVTAFLQPLTHKLCNKQNVVELIVEKLDAMVDTPMGKAAPKFYNYIGTIFIFILVSNISGLLGLRPPTADYGVTLPLGVLTFYIDSL